jgi:hypothetical protein
MEYTELKNGKFISHINFNEGGELNYSFEIIYPNHIMNGTEIIKNVWTMKTDFMTYGTPEIVFYHKARPNKPYKTVNELLKSLGLPKLKKD